MNVHTHHPKAVPGKPFLTLLRYNAPYWRSYLGGALLAAGFVGIGLAVPFVIRAAVARFENQTMTHALLLRYFLLLLGIAAVTGLARYWQRTWMIRASRKFEYDLRNDYFEHIQRLSPEFYHRTKTGDIMARASNDLNYVRMLIGPGIMGSVDAIRLPVALGLMLSLSPQLTLFALLPLPAMSLAVYYFVMQMHRRSKIVQEEFAAVTSRAQENLAGARVVKAYGIAERELRDFRERSAKYMRESIRLATVLSLGWPIIMGLMGLTMLIAVWRGGLMVIRSALLLSDFSGFLVLLMMLTWPLAQFGWILSVYQRASVSMGRMLEVFAEVPAIRDHEGTRHDIVCLNGGIRFEHVSLAHGVASVLENVDFELDAGHTMAVVGPAGAGKTSIVSLITREFDPTSGRVLIDGVDAREIPIRTLRRAIGYVPQETFLFSDTILGNVTFGRPDAHPDEVAHACEIAQFAETVASMPEGYDTILGERGVNLSGGQKQRLAIARALLCDPRILVLDDALSSVDAHTEERILRRLKEVMASRTSIVISHRIAAVQHADLILVIEAGKIVDRGCHNELLERRGLYTRIYQRQRLEEDLEQA